MRLSSNDDDSLWNLDSLLDHIIPMNTIENIHEHPLAILNGCRHLSIIYGAIVIGHFNSTFSEDVVCQSLFSALLYFNELRLEHRVVTEGC